MSRYQMLVRVLDGIRNEAAGTNLEKRYGVGSEVQEEIWQARARAYIHLYLKVMFGLYDFNERENFVTDGSQDGGIDGYYIDIQSRIVFLIQSKFRHSEVNFENKPISVEELLSMEIKRILSGSSEDEKGCPYNGKIKGLQRRISEVADIGRYKYKVVVLANMENISPDKLSRLADGLPCEVVNFSESYRILLYPVLSGVLYKANEISISVDLSNKNAGSKISYAVSAAGLDCQITVAFVPTIEIARVMSKYRNAILSYNPRNYLEFEGEKVNLAIRNCIMLETGNDFALLNNGITIVCDEIGINEFSGKQHKAQLFLKNPQIINGGQTAFTLSRIFDELSSDEERKVFDGKEVMIKAIAVESLDQGEAAIAGRVKLIEKISSATNSQTVVTTADRRSSDPIYFKIQSVLFDDFGLLYERKRGEFGDGVRNKYISAEQIVGRTQFARIYLAANGSINKALRKRVSYNDIKGDVDSDKPALERFVLGLHLFNMFKGQRISGGLQNQMLVLPKVHAGVFIASQMSGDLQQKAAEAKVYLERRWDAFVDYVAAVDPKFVRTTVYTSGDEKIIINELRTGRNIFNVAYVDLVYRYFQEQLQRRAPS